MKRQSKILLLEILLCIALIVLSFYLSHYVYVDVYNMGFAVILLTSLVTTTLLSWKKQVNSKPRFRWEVYAIICIGITIFVFTKPKYTYEQGKHLLRGKNYESIGSLEDKSLISFELERNYFIPSAYLYTGRKNGEEYYFQVQPKTGEIYFLKVGEGNYIDNYLKLKEEESSGN